MTAEALRATDQAPGGKGGDVTPIGLRRAARGPSRRASGGGDRTSLPTIAAPARPADAVPPSVPPVDRREAALRSENDALHEKLARVSRAIHGLASDLAASRRESRRQELEIGALRAENAELRARLARGPADGPAARPR